MNEYYCFPDQAGAQDCLDAINNSGWFPIVGNVEGEPAPNNQQTTQWAEAPMELANGDWCVPRVEEEKLDRAGVTQAERDQFIAAYGQDIRTLTPADFPAEPE